MYVRGKLRRWLGYEYLVEVGECGVQLRPIYRGDVRLELDGHPHADRRQARRHPHRHTARREGYRHGSIVESTYMYMHMYMYMYMHMYMHMLPFRRLVT